VDQNATAHFANAVQLTALDLAINSLFRGPQQSRGFRHRQKLQRWRQTSRIRGSGRALLPGGLISFLAHYGTQLFRSPAPDAGAAARLSGGS
jgi:hypothetical protein